MTNWRGVTNWGPTDMIRSQSERLILTNHVFRDQTLNSGARKVAVNSFVGQIVHEESALKMIGLRIGSAGNFKKRTIVHSVV